MLLGTRKREHIVRPEHDGARWARINFQQKIICEVREFSIIWRRVRVVYCASLLKRCAPYKAPAVRIRPSPQEKFDVSQI